MGILKAIGVFFRLSPPTLRKWVFVVLCGIPACTWVLTLSCSQKAGIKSSEIPFLTDSTQCFRCHPQQIQILESRGARHKTDVDCLDCHREHPPQGSDYITACSQCHSGKPHFKLAKCSSCHADTHAPLDLKLEGPISAPCLTCHQQQGQEIQNHPSAHTKMACNECHSKHRQVPDCMTCHEKHAQEMDFAACVSCHSVHQPTVVSYTQDTPSSYCATCHKQAKNLLDKNTTKHHDLDCAYCHRYVHQATPPCYVCHATSHPQAIMEKISDCNYCHGTAHDLRG